MRRILLLFLFIFVYNIIWAHDTLSIDSTKQQQKQRMVDPSIGDRVQVDTINQLIPNMPLDYSDRQRLKPPGKVGKRSEQVEQLHSRISRDHLREEFMKNERLRPSNEQSQRYRREYTDRKQSLEKRRTASLTKKEEAEKQFKTLQNGTIDSTALASGQQKAETLLEQAVTEQVSLPNEAQPIDLRSQLQNDLTGYQGFSSNKKVSKEAINEKIQGRIDQLGANYEEIISENIAKSKKEMQQRKRRYADLPNSKEADRKRMNPLSEVPLRQRLKYGTNFRIIPGNTTQVSLSPELSYLIYPQLYLGLGLAYQVSIGFNDLNPHFSNGEEGLSTRFFSQYSLPKGFFAHGEYAWLPDLTQKPEGNTPSMPSNKILLGIGKTFHIRGNISGNAQVLYNFNHDPELPNSKPWEYRFGFTFSPKKKKETQD